METNARHISYVLGFLTSLLVAVSITAISRLPERYVFSVLFGILAFLIFILLFKKGNWRIMFKGINRCFKYSSCISKDFLVLLLYFVSIVLALLVPSNDKAQFVIWMQIPIIGYARLFAGLLLSSILPGYGLLRLLDRKNRFDGLNLVVFSFFTGVFVTTFLSYFLMFLNVAIESTFLAALVLNIIILLLYTFSFIIKIRKENLTKKVEKLSYNFDYLILACVFCFFILGWLIYYSSYPLGSTGDMWDHYGTYLRLANGVNIFSSAHLTYLGAETWLPLHYVTVSQLTGFPAINGWMVYAFINFFYFLAVYQTVRGIVGVNHPRIPVIATVITVLFSGFGWIQALSLSSSNNWLTALNSAGNMTYNDIIYTFLYGPIPQYFSLAALFSLLYLMVRKEKFDLTSAFLTVVLVALGLLVHSPEIIVLPIFYYCYLLFVRHEEFGRLKKYSLSILVGLFVVFLVGLPFSSHFYFDVEQPLLFLFLAVSLTFILMHFRGKFSNSFAFPKRLGILLVGAIWVLYIMSFFAWKNTLNLDVTANLVDVGLKPWYIYPVNNGVSLLLGLLGLTCLIVWRKHNLENAKFLLLTIVALFLTGIIISYVNINIFATGYWEKRFYSFMILPLSILGAFFIVEIVPKLTFGKVAKGFRDQSYNSAITGLLISLIVISGVSSNILALDRIAFTSQSDPYAASSDKELKALDFLRVNASAGATVLGFSTISNRFAYIFSGMNHLNSPYWFTKGNSPYQFTDITNPELALKMLYSLNVTYLYVTESDMKTLHSNGFVVDHLLKYLPIAFQNEAVTIYRVPKLNPPSSDSNLTLAIPSYLFDALSDQSTLLQNLPRQMIFNETFVDHANGSTGAPTWTIVNGTWTVENGVYTGKESKYAVSSSFVSGNILSDFSFKTDFKISSGYYAGVTFRRVDSSNFYAALISVDGKNNDLYKMVDGKLILIKHSTGPLIGDKWSTLAVDAFGDQFNIKLNGELILSASDTLFPTGRVGLLVDASTSYFDNVTISQPPDVGASFDSTFYLPIDMLAQSGLEYSIKTNEDRSMFNSKYILLPSDKSWSNEQIYDYLAWVNKGGNLIVLNGDGLGNFAQALSIKSNSIEQIEVNSAAVGQLTALELGTFPVTSLFSSDEHTKVVASYTNQNSRSEPLAFAKQIGKGEIFYVNINPLFKNFHSSNDNRAANFAKIGGFISLLNLDTPNFKDIPSDARWRYMLYDTTWIRDYGHLFGTVSMESDSIVFPYDQFNVDQMEILNASGTINGASIQGRTIQGGTIMNFVKEGTIYSVIDSTDLYLLPTNYGTYVGSLLNSNSDVSMQIRNGNITFSIVTNANTNFEVNLQSGTLIMKNVRTNSLSETPINYDAILPKNITLDTETLLFQHNPVITVNGAASFPEAYIPNYINYVNGFPVQINGTTYFKFDCSSDNVMMLTDFSYLGAFQTSQDTDKISMVYWELTAIPWISILTSPSFLILCIILAIAIITIYQMRSQSSKALPTPNGLQSTKKFSRNTSA
jgi:hypothetical protein